MARPKGVKQKRNESKYWLPNGVILKDNQSQDYNKESKLVFIDKQFGEFISTFHAIQNANDSTHQLAVQQRRENTNKERYGGVNPHCSQEVRNKFKETMKEKYGVEHALLNKDLFNKSKETLKRNYNVENPMESLEIKGRLKSSILKKYGTENVMNNPEIKKKLKDKSIELGYTVPLSNGYTIAQYCTFLGLPFLSRAFQIRNNHGDEITIQWLDNRKQAISSLELLFNKHFPDAIRYQKVPNQLKGKGYRPDFIYNNTYIDVDGLLYHSEKYKENNFHFNKTKCYRDSGLKYIQFRQDEITDKIDIVKSILNIKTKSNTIKRIFARKLKIKEISQSLANNFFERTHLMGSFNGAKCIALVSENDNIEACLSYKHIKTNIIDVSRFSCNLNTIVVGGLSKLLNYMIEKEDPSIVQSFVDLRYGTGDSLIKLGFSNESVTIGWKWTDGWQTYSRQSCMAGMDERKLSEREYANELGWFKIYDAGQAKFVKTL